MPRKTDATAFEKICLYYLEYLYFAQLNNFAQMLTNRHFSLL